MLKFRLRLKPLMIAVLFLISPLLMLKAYACSNESSWAYNATDNTCVKQWLPQTPATFKSYGECLNSRIISITYTFGAKYTGTQMKISGNEPSEDIPLKGQVFATVKDVSVVGYPAGGVASDYLGSSGSINSVSKAELDSVFCRNDSLTRWTEHNGFAIKTQIACYEAKMGGNDVDSHKEYMTQFECLVSSGEKHFTHTSGGVWRWDRNYVRNKKKNRVDCFTFLVDKEPSCGNRGCPLAEILPNPCGDNPSPPPDDDCPDLNLTIRGTLLPVRRGTAKVTGDWCD